MRSRQQFVFVKRVILFLFCALVLFCAAPSDAHMYFSFPSDSEKAGQVDIYTAFALDPPAADESGYGVIKYDIKGRLVGPSGTTNVTNFPFSDSATGRTYTDAELAAMGEAAESAVDSRKSTVAVQGGGTSVFLTESDYENDELYEGTTYHQEFICASKAFLNLTADGASTKTYLTSGLELVPVDDLAGLAPVSGMRVKALLDGAPVAGLGIYLSYEGCPQNPELHGEVAAMRVATTGSDGIATLRMPSRGGNTYLFAMNLGAASTGTNFVGQMASLSFVLPPGDDIEMDVSDALFRSNVAGLGTPIYVDAESNNFLLSQFGIVWANDLMSQPAGTSSFVSGKSGQLPGSGTGATFRFPMDIAGARVKGAIGTEQNLELTPDIVGQSTFDDMVAFLRSSRASKPDRFITGEGMTFYVPYTAGDFLGEFGISVMARFADGTERDVSDNYMMGVVYDESMFADGRIYIVYGTLFVDSVSDNGSYVTDLTPYFDPSDFAKMPLLHDGAADNTIEIAYWLAREENASGGSSGCNAGLPLVILAFAAMGMGLVAGKKR